MSLDPNKPEARAPRDRARPQELSITGQRVFQCLSLGLVVFDEQLEILHHNPAADFLVADHPNIATALTALTVDARYQDWRQALRDVIASGHQQRFEQVLYRDSQGVERLLNLQCIALTDPQSNNITGGTLVIEDVTSAVSMEKRLAVSERMAAVGKLAARVAHELNNPLDGILRYLGLASRAIDGGHPEKIFDYLKHARSGLLRMADIVREMVEFSRSTGTAFDDAGINTVVEEAVRVMADQAMERNVAIICDLADGLPAIRGTNLFQVFCNLIKNAVDAMPDGGTLTIRTRTDERNVVIRFDDTGIGLPAEMDRIFEPFFTTKEPGKGTGLGLAVCKDIIEKYGGRIIPERRPSGGSSFLITIPLASCTPIRPQRGAAMPGPRTAFTSPPVEKETP